MPLAPVLLTLGAAIVGAVLGWWPLADWADRNIRTPADERMSLRRLRAWSAAATAAGFGAVTWRFGLDPVLPALLAVVATGVVLSIVDLTEHRLPNAVILPTLAAVAVLLVLASALTGEWMRLLWALAGGAAMFAFYFVLALIAPAGMGMGDVKFAAPLGLVLGWFGWSVWLVGLMAGFVVGGLVGLVALALRRVTLKGSIPFGPSMLAGAVAVILVLGA
ncbi:prepilin peptidase [Agromyces aurantiacus]|uniref:Prepilin peptidase n=1 Tax=Agromyces aurantiacus TaxID=165814 RepID=A0ABV9R3N2_9MICO|nr:A24 family peptidase [Agromyces aurantiacus]MBM7503274.1 leader peptidase (prepilin peptidase)/N-methyltransferase [Agromyces aurantiacus]